MAPPARARGHRRARGVRGRPIARGCHGIAAPLIEARGWGLRHPGRREWALRDVDLTIERGDRVLLLGPSGAGKSTLLAAIAGLIDPAGGAETVGSLRVHDEDPRHARDRTGLLFQDPESQIVMGRVGDDVAFGLENRCVPTGQIWPRVDAALAAVRLPYGRERSTDALSGGEQQRLALAGTLALAPEILLLDEPTANLDPDGASAFRAVLRDVLTDDRVTLVLVEHRVDEAVPLVNRVVVLEPGGGVVADGPPADVFSSRGAELAAAGVWVPGDAPSVARRGSGPSPEPLIRAEGAAFRYPGSAHDALAPTDIEIRSREALAIVGPNGAGKSTLALLLAGLLEPSAGRVVATETLAVRTELVIARWRARDLARRVGTVFQDPEHQFLTGSVVEELLLGPRRVGMPEAEARRRVADLLDRLALVELSAANPFTLSGGEQRRLSVATALATEPQVVILDEPTFGQDRRTWGELLRLLAGLRDAGRGICFATHDQAFERALADRTVRIGSDVT